MPTLSSFPDRPRADQLAALRAGLAHSNSARSPAMPFGVSALDERLASHGLDSAGLHEIAAASATLSDDAAATLFTAGIAARFAADPQLSIFWALTQFDLYAPGLEQVGLGPDKVFYAQAQKDNIVLAMAEDALRDGSLACVIAEVRQADQTATRRLQLAASDSRRPFFRHDPMAHRLPAIRAPRPSRRRPGALVGRTCTPAQWQSLFPRTGRL